MINNETLIFVGIILVIVLIECGSQYSLKKYKQTDKIINLIVGIIGYMVIALLIMTLSSMREMGMVNMIWSVISILAITLVGYFAFDEKVDIKDGVSIAIAILAVSSIEYRKNKNSAPKGQ